MLHAALTAAAAADAASLYAGFRAHFAVEGDGALAFVAEDRWTALNTMFARVEQLQLLTVLACAAVFIMWFHRIRLRAGLLAPTGFRWGPGWAIGGWFVPLACLWMPYRIAREAWTVGLRGATSPFWPLNLWWASFAGSLLLGRYASVSHRRAEDLGPFLDAVTVGMMADALNIIAAVAAMFFAARLTLMPDHDGAPATLH
ncbi:DUF4328 domain-containing protein [Streptomyces sp. NRRL F-2664]|uniref:DUF4328 domain-containing protein n=1 Tax=Streptomyces sp. NRRL F-2664 TaxID=1463842 RepID=UPI000691BBDF|nr:DUF4328 domain-containing protein [Streptomyces sp. NRRL F-2664]